MYLHLNFPLTITYPHLNFPFTRSPTCLGLSNTIQTKSVIKENGVEGRRVLNLLHLKLWLLQISKPRDCAHTLLLPPHPKVSEEVDQVRDTESLSFISVTLSLPMKVTQKLKSTDQNT